MDLPMARQLETGGHYCTLPVLGLECLRVLEPDTRSLTGCCFLCPVLISNIEKTLGPFYFQNWPECALASGQQEPLEGPGLPVELEALAVYLQRTYSRKATILSGLFRLLGEAQCPGLSASLGPSCQHNQSQSPIGPAQGQSPGV